MHRNTHRDARRRGLQAAECIAQVDFALCQQGRDAFFQQTADLFLVGGAVHFLIAADAGLQIGSQQPLCTTLGTHIPQEARRGRGKRRNLILSVQKFRVGLNAEAVRRIQIELHHRLQRDLVQQQAFRVHDVQPAAQLRQHIAAKGSGICVCKKQALAAQRLQRGQDAGAAGPLQPPEGVLAEQIIIIQPLHSGKCRFAFHLHAAAAACHSQGDCGQPLPQLVAAQKAGVCVHLNKGVKVFSRQDHAACRALLGPAIHPHCSLIQTLPCAYLTAQQLQKGAGLLIKGIPPVHKGQRLSVADAAAVFDVLQKIRDALDHILPPAVRNAQPQPWLRAGQQGQLRFQPDKTGALGHLAAAKVLQRGFLIGIQQPAGFVVRHRRFPVPLFAKQHLQTGSVAVAAGWLYSQPGSAPHHARNGIRLCSGGGRILFRIFHQQRTDVLAVGTLAVLVIRAAAGRADKAAVFPQPCLRVVIAAAAALHHGRNVAHPIGVDGAGALLDAPAVFFDPLKNSFAQKRADLVCIHGCSLPVSEAGNKPFYLIRIPHPAPGCKWKLRLLLGTKNPALFKEAGSFSGFTVTRQAWSARSRSQGRARGSFPASARSGYALPYRRPRRQSSRPRPAA